jgi:trimethylamine-N-oxide reductase (cytochrome c)
MALEKTQFAVILLGLEKLMAFTARRSTSFRERLKGKNLIAQIKLQDNSQGRTFLFKNGKVRSRSGIDPNADITIIYSSPELAVGANQCDEELSDRPRGTG